MQREQVVRKDEYLQDNKFEAAGQILIMSWSHFYNDLQIHSTNSPTTG